MELAEETLLRKRIFADLDVMTSHTDGTLSREQLLNYQIDGQKLQLIDYSRGIWNPARFSATLSVVSTPGGPYPDKEIVPGVWEYSFQNVSGGVNKKLIAVHELGAEIILFHKLEPNVYLPIYPVKVIGVDHKRQLVTLAISQLADIDIHAPSEVERRWATSEAARRVHQPAFRAMVLRAYDTQCTVCHFRHAELLDAAHILSDRHERGLARTSNGMSMCKIHHAAYDQNFMGIDADYRIHINSGLLHEVDGPMLRHGLQEMDGQAIILPSRKADHPNRDNLEERFEAFNMSQG
ncbi:MAG: HNH endonuclease [Scrofimicrobium sp.]